ncbi:MAG: Methyltransferase type 11 [Acidimicrobiia bacterium]|nr:Methyltransferase type 11 [Acidimicrobiia bacterium]
MTLQSLGGPGLGGAIRRLGPWFHNLHLPDGAQTAPDHPLGDFPRFKWLELGAALPADLRGCRALDIGCNAGFYTFELAKRGAQVLGIDHDSHYLRQAEWARTELGLEKQVELKQLGVYDLARLDDTFDLVLFMGVLYHLRHPLLALEIVAERMRGTLVLQTLTAPGDPAGPPPADLSLDQRDLLTEPSWPSMAFVEQSMAGDPTNWWVPNAAAVEAMVRSSGLTVVGRPGHEMWLCERRGPLPHQAELDAATGRR